MKIFMYLDSLGLLLCKSHEMNTGEVVSVHMSACFISATYEWMSAKLRMGDLHE
jgi:hypothetical protein